MSPEKNPYEDLREIVKKSVEEGLDQETLIRDFTTYWFRYFHYTTDPLDVLTAEDSFPKELINLFVDRYAEIKIISKYIGSSKSLPAPLHLAIIGPFGIGKHTTLKVICKLIHESYPNIKLSFYDFNGFDYLSSEEISDKDLKTINDKNLDVRLLSGTIHTSSFFTRNISKFRENSKLLISIWHLHEYPLVNDLQVNKEIYFRNYIKDEVLGIFKKRIEKFLIQEEVPKKYVDNLNKYVLPEIASFCDGNLRIAFLVFEMFHQKALIKNLPLLPVDFINHEMRQLKEFKAQKLTKKEQEILRIHITQPGKYITTTVLVEEYAYEHSVAWKYLERMTKKGYFHKTPGNPSRYEINDLYLSLYEEKIKKEIIFKEI